MQIKNIPIGDIIPNPKNPRIDLKPGMPLYDKLSKSINEFGYVDPIIWNERTGMIVSGHQRFQVMKDLAEQKGETLSDVPVCVVDMSEDKQNTFMIAVNKITGLWDQEKLASLFRELDSDDYVFTGFEDFEIDTLLNGVKELDIADEAEPTPERDTFALSFLFSKDDEAIIKAKIKEKGKEQITAEILKVIMD